MWWLALLACARPGLHAEGGDVATIAAVRLDLETGEASVAPDPFVAAVDRAMAIAGLSGEALAALPDGMERGRVDARVVRLADAGPAREVVLVEASARFFSLIEGRYRWVVTVDAGWKAPGSDAVTERFEVPVFLQFQHQGEKDALVAAAPVVERRIARFLGDARGR